jgi:heme exporter protein A
MITVRGLTKRFGGRPVLRDMQVDIPRGQCLSLIGPNGAGKTTLLRILAGLSRPTRGSVSIAGFDLRAAPEKARQQVGFLSHQPLLYDELTALENLRFFGVMYDVPQLETRIDTLLAQVGLQRRRADLVRTYSRGMKQRLSIARALLHDPQVLLLDEPYTGLDQGAAEMLDGVLAQSITTSHTVVLTTHDLSQGLRFSQRAVILAQGQIRFEMDQQNWDEALFRQQCRHYMAQSGV